MIRAMASSVSALSGIVAKSHQTIHFVSSAPSKIPYGGFSPVRLQTHLTRRPPSRACQRPLIGRHCWCLRSRRLFRSRSCDQAAPRTSDHNRGSSGPWLPDRLYCPASSSLTMATSAPLSVTQRLMDYSVRLRTTPANRRGSPIYSANPFTPCRHPYPGGPSDCSRGCLHRWCCLRRISTGSTTTNPTAPDQVGSVTRLQCSLHATAWNVASPAPARTFTTELSRAGSPPTPRSVITEWSHHHLPLPDSHRLDCRLYGLRANETLIETVEHRTQGKKRRRGEYRTSNRTEERMWAKGVTRRQSRERGEDLTTEELVAASSIC